MESQQMALSCNDDFIASIIINSSENPRNDESLMSDDDFAQELQLQEVIISSLINLSLKNRESEKKLTFEIGEPSTTAEAAAEGGESSQSLCEICAEKKDSDGMFPLQNCSHSFCKDCISRHISIKIEKRTIINASSSAETIACPGGGCGGALGVAACREIVPPEVVAKWDEVLCESAIAAAERVYCPYNNCSALLVNDGGGCGVIREAECPFCRRLFCANCGVPWHTGIDCEGFSGLKKDEREKEDLMVHELAKNHKWKRCFRCRFFVERNEGCLHMTCRCGYQFCYACGETWSSTHGGCQ